MNKELKEKVIKAGKAAFSFVKENKFMFLQVGIMLLPAVIGECSDATSYANSIEITPLKTPLQKLSSALNGPIPGAIIGISTALGGCSWALGWEQQVTQRCVKGVGGGAIAMGAGSFMDSVGIGSSCLF